MPSREPGAPHTPRIGRRVRPEYISMQPDSQVNEHQGSDERPSASTNVSVRIVGGRRPLKPGLPGPLMLKLGPPIARSPTPSPSMSPIATVTAYSSHPST